MSERVHWCGCREGGLHYYGCALSGFVDATATPPPPNVPTAADVAGDETGEAS